MIGCGNSRLSAQLYEAGFQNIVYIDISEIVINQMKARFKEMPKMQWLRMDAAKLELPDSSFDLVIDKGTMDSILCGANSFHNVHQMNKNVSRVLKRGAHYVVISYGQPDTRIDHFRRKRLSWTVEHKTIDKPVFHGDSAQAASYHIYIMSKGDDAAAPAEENDDDDDDEDDDFYDRFQDAAAQGAR